MDGEACRSEVGAEGGQSLRWHAHERMLGGMAMRQNEQCPRMMAVATGCVGRCIL
jgi:hypothetical protein